MGIVRSKKVVVSFVIVVAVVLFFFLFGSPRLLARSGEPDFCVECHVMEPAYESWIHSGAHRRNKCVDCHLPNENQGSHYMWKAINGLKDVLVFYSGRVSEHIRLTSHGRKVLQSNCVRCHETTVMLIDKERRCWDCHRRITHKGTGAIETF
jgi:cytochrome c nitrite reductase small subunit